MRRRKIECEGKIIRINHHELFYSGRHNYYNSIIHGLPYQLSYQTVEYTIRVELTDSKSRLEVMDFCLYGDYMGLFDVGDIVSLIAYEHKGRKIVKSIYNKTTASPVRSDLQIPAWVIRARLIIPVLIWTVFISFFVGFVHSAIWGLATALFCVVVSIISFIIIFIRESVE